MMNLKTTEERVVYALENYPSTKKSDMDLILAVYALIDREIVKLPFQHVLRLVANDSRFPSFETIRRSRQKAQAQRPELKDEQTAKVREGKVQDSYKEYALS